MIEYDYPNLYQNRPAMILSFYFERQGLALNKELVALSIKLADWLGIEWCEFVVAFEHENLPVKSFHKYKRTSRRWIQLLKLMEVETIENFGLSSYTIDGTEGECIAALNIDFRYMFDKPNTCCLYLVPSALDSVRMDQMEEWLLPFFSFAVEVFKPFYGFVHVGDLGHNWYLYASGVEDSSFPVEGSESIDAFNSRDILQAKVPRVYWGNLLSAKHIERLGNIDELRAWELGSPEWQVYHDAVPNTEFCQSKDVHPAKPSVRVDWPVCVKQLGEDYIFFSLSSNPLDWSPNIGIGGMIKAEYKRITKLFRSKGLMV